jgi:tRNA G37 N-methylase TrmD
VPEVLLSGDHGRIAKWRQEQAIDATRRRDAQASSTRTQTTQVQRSTP